MDNSFLNSKTGMDLNDIIMEEMSPYDNSYPIHFFANGLKDSLKQAEKAAKDIYRMVLNEVPIAEQIKQANKKGFRLVVDTTDSMLDAIDKGKIKLTTEKNGQTFAQIRKPNGQYGSKLPIKREEFAKGIDPVQMANSLQLKALQKQMQEISEQLYMIDYSVQEVLQGQQNDRIGLYYSGMALFLEARNITNGEMKNALIVQAIRALSDSIFQLSSTMQSDVKYLVNKEYNNVKGKNRERMIDEKMSNINKSFAFIHQATMLKAGIYCEIGELSSMATVLEEYSHFIEDTVEKNASLLAQCDSSDNGLENGIWKSRAKLKLDVADFTKKINMSEKTIFLGITKEEE